MEYGKLKNYIDGEWVESQSDEVLDVGNPATGEVIAQVPLSTVEEVNRAVSAAAEAFQEWRETPSPVRARYMLRLKVLMEEHFEDLACAIVKEHGKIIDEARGEVRRAIENVEVAASVPSLMMGYNAEDIAAGIDEECVLQPVGVFCCVAPFNFPAMVPFWFLPYAVACGNTFIVKPSEICPVSQDRLFEMLDEVDFPPGVVNLVHGAKGVVDALLTHPDVAGVSFVGSTPVGKYIYSTAAALLTSAFGTAGQRCLSGALVLAVGDVYEPLKAQLVEAASRLKIGDGLDEATQMGPVVSQKSLDRILGYVEKGVEEGAELILDGRGVQVEGYPSGHFIGPNIFDQVKPEMTIAREEIFGPVLGIIAVADFEEALAIIKGIPYGNAASLFTTSGKWAREFKYRLPCGNIGINIGVAAPIATFPFAGMKDSFFGDLHGQGRDAIQFFTDRKVVITRWF